MKTIEGVVADPGQAAAHAFQRLGEIDLAEPDLERFPRFAEALKHAFVAELEPGDAIFIPALWWHGVEASGGFNILVNYWWKGQAGAQTASDSGLNCLLHCLLTLKRLPAEQRQVWKMVFDHYIFSANEQSVDRLNWTAGAVGGSRSPSGSRMVVERTAMLAMLYCGVSTVGPP